VLHAKLHWPDTQRGCAKRMLVEQLPLGHPQLVPQGPQLGSQLVVSTQEPRHSVVPGPHVKPQTPCEQVMTVLAVDVPHE
jgi:hypothetical protein